MHTPEVLGSRKTFARSLAAKDSDNGLRPQDIYCPECANLAEAITQYAARLSIVDCQIQSPRHSQGNRRRFAVPKCITGRRRNKLEKQIQLCAFKRDDRYPG